MKVSQHQIIMASTSNLFPGSSTSDLKPGATTSNLKKEESTLLENYARYAEPDGWIIDVVKHREEMKK
jgi:hypothetical protein